MKKVKKLNNNLYMQLKALNEMKKNLIINQLKIKKKHKIILYITFSHNNIFSILINNNKKKKNIIYRLTAAELGFKGKKQVTMIAFLTLLFKYVEIFETKKIRKVIIKTRGRHKYKKLIPKFFKKKKIKLVKIRDKTPVVFNGTKKKNKRRV